MTGQVVTLQIDGKDLSARDDQTILEVATENNIRIPALCYMTGLSLYGGCRLCLV
ncbi:MAG TPA: 2Fe-2S iron-sulfur cluster-binding protein, partial [Blastocatellia bacterium]|nr:2Fe-2S iron-sulfur cluster-binding protein [Blastocatellia bacterium]